MLSTDKLFDCLIWSFIPTPTPVLIFVSVSAFLDNLSFLTGILNDESNLVLFPNSLKFLFENDGEIPYTNIVSELSNNNECISADAVVLEII